MLNWSDASLKALPAILKFLKVDEKPNCEDLKKEVKLLIIRLTEELEEEKVDFEELDLGSLYGDISEFNSHY